MKDILKLFKLFHQIFYSAFLSPLCVTIELICNFKKFGRKLLNFNFLILNHKHMILILLIKFFYLLAQEFSSLFLVICKLLRYYSVSIYQLSFRN